jgi:hypothetical protein
MNTFYGHGFMGPGEFGGIAPMFGIGAAVFGTLVVIALIWSIAWKGFALWYAARSGERYWFVALMVVNTFGILEILYLFVFRKERWNIVSKKFGGEAKMQKEDASLPTAESSPAE